MKRPTAHSFKWGGDGHTRYTLRLDVDGVVRLLLGRWERTAASAMFADNVLFAMHAPSMVAPGFSLSMIADVIGQLCCGLDQHTYTHRDSSWSVVREWLTDAYLFAGGDPDFVDAIGNANGTVVH